MLILYQWYCSDAVFFDRINIFWSFKMREAKEYSSVGVLWHLNLVADGQELLLQQMQPPAQSESQNKIPLHVPWEQTTPYSAIHNTTWKAVSSHLNMKNSSFFKLSLGISSKRLIYMISDITLQKSSAIRVLRDRKTCSSFCTRQY